MVVKKVSDIPEIKPEDVDYFTEDEKFFKDAIAGAIGLIELYNKDIERLQYGVKIQEIVKEALIHERTERGIREI